jgi:hypothetical protein
MSTRRGIYAFTGMLIMAIVDLVVNLLAAAIQQRAFADQFNNCSISWLIGLAVVGLLLGYWLGADVKLPGESLPAAQTSDSHDRKTITMTRLHALLSYARLRGKGIHLSDILLIGSRIDIDTSD